MHAIRQMPDFFSDRQKNWLTLFWFYGIIPSVPMMRLLRDGTHADVAELADALDSGSSRGNSVEVQVLLPAPK